MSGEASALTVRLAERVEPDAALTATALDRIETLTDRLGHGASLGYDERGLLDETLVIVTGDHGESIFDDGTLGHSSRYSPAQIEIPLVIAGAGVAVGAVLYMFAESVFPYRPEPADTGQQSLLAKNLAKAEEMYSPEVFGRSGSDVVVVE